MPRTLSGQGHPLAQVNEQLRILGPGGAFTAFERTLASHGLPAPVAAPIEVLQINLGKLCNQTCKHCHVDAGPDRTEVMTRETMRSCLQVLDRSSIPTVDLTGGAPELNPDFRWLVEEVRGRGRRVIDRCNLTILTLPRFRDLADFLAANRVEVVASLPHYQPRSADAQRGEGVFDASIDGIRRLNAVGYGQEGSGLQLNLVYNPSGAFLPPRQAALEADYRRELAAKHGVAFNHLYVLTNLPINRFLEFLIRTAQYESYMSRLIDAFNPGTVDGLMCQTTLSVAWDGTLHDCDFNQQLGLGLAAGAPRHIDDFQPVDASVRPIVTGLHCYGCTAGAGSSCGGETAR